jgi:hypothetical protein
MTQSWVGKRLKIATGEIIIHQALLPKNLTISVGERNFNFQFALYFT